MSAALSRAFRQRFGRPPELVVRAPGRVNLIGEHTDYNNLPVLPLAIDRAIEVAAARGDEGQIALHNDDHRYPPRRFACAEAPLAPLPPGDWGNYAKAALLGVRRLTGADPGGAQLLVAGDIPPGAGLSSSSALVVALAVALLELDRRGWDAAALAEQLARAERFVGTKSGGMDQAVCLLARADHALRIDFAPLRTRPAPLPRDHAVVVCHSLVRAEKSALARAAYNRRVIECAVAARVLARRLGLPAADGARLGDLRRGAPQRAASWFVEQLAAVLPDEPLALAEVARRAELPPAELSAIAAEAEGEVDAWPLLARARHVLHESERVERAERALLADDSATLGALLDASHASCRDDYEISCPAIEELVRAAGDGGALGTRLTGAGFGGCTISLAPRAELPRLLAHLDSAFYRPRGARASDACFALQAAGGAAVIADRR